MQIVAQDLVVRKQRVRPCHAHTAMCTNALSYMSSIVGSCHLVSTSHSCMSSMLIPPCPLMYNVATCMSMTMVTQVIMYAHDIHACQALHRHVILYVYHNHVCHHMQWYLCVQVTSQLQKPRVMMAPVCRSRWK
jgi:hypothetical protein